jgi:hypothetical protein
VLRNFLEKEPLTPDLHRRLIRYFLAKRPHAENDRDKLDFLVTSYFSAAADGRPLTELRELRAALDEFFEGLTPKALGTNEEVMLHEMESLAARVDDFNDFDQLVQARMVERVRALKTNLGASFYHPQVLANVVRFNLLFRARFDRLFQEQLSAVRRETWSRIQQAWRVVGEIEEAYEELHAPEVERSGTVIMQAIPRPGEGPVGRPLETENERQPLDRLARRGDVSPKETELRGIVLRLSRYLERLPREQIRGEKVHFPLRRTKLELARWEREAFSQPEEGEFTKSAQLIQLALGVVAWVDEELALYEQSVGDRYLWKTHFDSLSYAVARALELLEGIRALVEPDVAEEESNWWSPLLHTALRLSRTLNRLVPVFRESDAA